MDECYLTTAWHTGTKYFKAGLEKHYRVAYSHLNDSVINQLPNYKTVYTTYRDPHRVAASWINRGHFSGKQDLSVIYGKWVEQWKCYEQLKQFDPKVLDFSKGKYQHGIRFPDSPINSHADVRGAHKALNEGKVLTMIPKELLDLAIDCSRWATDG